MYNDLTEDDIRKMEEEIEYRKVVVRKELLEDVRQRKRRTGMRAESAICRE